MAIKTKPDERPMMKCGHTANATYNGGKPCCAICIGIHPGATVIDKRPPSLKGRKAICPYCKRVVPSERNLPFFEYRPKMQYDSYYDGCRGWD